MKFLLTAVNAKYIHSNPAIYSLRAHAGEELQQHIELAEYTINQNFSDILADIHIHDRCQGQFRKSRGHHRNRKSADSCGFLRHGCHRLPCRCSSLFPTAYRFTRRGLWQDDLPSVGGGVLVLLFRRVACSPADRTLSACRRRRRCRLLL